MSSEAILTPNPRDQVLRNDDLLRIIFHFVALEQREADNQHQPERPSVNQQFLPIALTHKGFLEAALNVIWKNIPNLLPLLKLIPGFCKVDGEYLLTSVNATEGHWERVGFYAKRVESITFTAQDEVISSLVYQTLSMYQSSYLPGLGIPVPSLTAMTVQCSTKTDYASALFIATASRNLLKVKVVKIIPESFTFLRQLLLVLTHRHSQLEELELEGNGTEALLLSLIRQITLFSALSRLSLDFPGAWPLQAAVLRPLPSMKSLRHLSLRISEHKGGKRNLDTKNPRYTFPSLSKLEISGSTLLAVLKALARIVAPRIQHIHIQFNAGSSLHKNDATHFKERIRRQIGMRGYPDLRTFRVTQSDASKFDFVSEELFTASESPSSNLGITPPLHLQHLHFEMCTTSNTKSFLTIVAERCPNLLSLTLPASNSDPDDAKPSLTCLALLAKGCPHLLNLRICLQLHRPTPNHFHNALASRGAEVEELNRIHPLRSLQISDAGGNQTFGITDLISMSKYLHRLFPRLDKLGGYRDAAGRGMGSVEVFEALRELTLALGEAQEKGAATALAQAKRSKDIRVLVPPVQPGRQARGGGRVEEASVQTERDEVTLREGHSLPKEVSVQTDAEADLHSIPDGLVARDARLEDASVQTDKETITEAGEGDQELQCEETSVHSVDEPVTVQWDDCSVETGDCHQVSG
ncbi:hypothetical protein CC1G_11279 [Coprinopsis cinerea okayama7|uniref:Uncharacterized protein n=1 Tax=Coprinopsis cinerea (strain Okayama-7 / 130 / ATCC MYA-4618 / FGSC 9003) TaxID=240176 RepID=A8PDN0_COPC7|nr:hypothetical protein CC1G_11279 [Coprinopsis cinerea okayama7\|eukprot:XP_001840631.1 hypothetical protein CC1G_11279 [Coprinopsis cinerea okayama7\